MADETTWEGVAVAEEIARWLNSPGVGCEHLLIAALRAQDADAGDMERATKAIAAAKALLPPDRPPTTPDGRVALTADAERALDLAASAARRRSAASVAPDDVIRAVREIREPVSTALLEQLEIGDREDEGDAFLWPESELEPRWPEHLPGELPQGGPLGKFADGALVLSRPDRLSPARPWVLARGRRVVKAYDLAAPGIEADKRRAEADIAVHLSDLPGVVRTVRTGEVGSWLLIEMERANDGLDRHLADIESKRRIPLSRSRYAELFSGVAETLQALADRGMVHRDVKPANLLFDDGHSRLLVADFSISGPISKRPRRTPKHVSGEPQGTDRYIAPEQYDARISPAVDQYSLGVTATDTFAHLPPTASIDAVLARATAWRPEDRFDSVAEFGLALRAAADDRGDRRLSDRLERIKPAWRHAWAPALVAATLAYLALLTVPVARPTPVRLLAVPLVGLAVLLAVRALARLHGQRTRPRLSLANQVWLARLLSVPMIALVAISHPKDPKHFAESAVPLVAVAYGVTAWLGSTPPEAGRWLIVLARRWERRRRSGGRTALLSSIGAALVLTGVVAWLPTAVYRTRPPSQTPPSQPASEVGYMQVLGQFRSDLLHRDPTAACRLVVPTRPGDRSCLSWASAARAALEEDLLRSPRTSAFLGDTPLAALTIAPQATTGDPGVTIETTAAGTVIGFGTFTAPTVVEVDVPRPPLNPTAGKGLWTYEITHRAGHWIISGVTACSNPTGANCTYFTFLRQ